MLGGGKTFAYFARIQEEERAAALPTVAMIARDPERHLDEPLPADWRTLGMVDRLCEAATNELVRSISRSLHLAQLAAAIADALPESYPSILRAQRAAHAWKALANAHRFASRYDAAFSALDLAEQRLAEEMTLAYDRAILRLARGVTLSEARRFDAALDVLGEARQIFEDHGDLRQVAQCDLALGMTLQYLGRIVDARQTYMRVIPAARAASDLHTVAAAYHNLGRAAADAGDFNGAVDALQQARAIFRDLDMPIESARAVWSIGAAELTAGHLESAIRILTGARRELLDLGMPEEAGLAGVDLIEALLATNARASARELAGVVIEEFRHAQLNERALHAVAYLRETADVALPASARHVATYLRRLKDEPALLFIEPESRG